MLTGPRSDPKRPVHFPRASDQIREAERSLGHRGVSGEGEPRMNRRAMMFRTAAAAAFAAALGRARSEGSGGSPSLNSLFDEFMKERLDISPLMVTNLGLDTGVRAQQ